MSMPTLLYLHALAPPKSGGSTVVLRRVLSGLDGIEVVTLTDRHFRRQVKAGGPTIPGDYRWFLRTPGWFTGSLVGRAVTAALDLVLAVLAGVTGAAIVRRRRASWVLSVVDNGFSVVAGTVAARLAGVPHLIWVFDLWEENAYAEVDRWVAARLEGPLWRSADALICHAQEMSDHYERKYGVPAVVLPTPVDAGLEPAPGPAGAGAPGAEREVLYAGAMYWAQEEALRRLARVCARTDGVRLTVVGDAEELRAAGIEADRVEPRTSPEEFQQRVRRADVAFLGLSFGTAHPELIATATPARLPEYMAAGVPLLIHAPAGSHVTEYARREDFAEVVDTADDDALARGLRRVLDNPATGTIRARRARELAVERHDAVRVRAAARDLLMSLRDR